MFVVLDPGDPVNAVDLGRLRACSGDCLNIEDVYDGNRGTQEGTKKYLSRHVAWDFLSRRGRQ